jgi:rhamnulokinase
MKTTANFLAIDLGVYSGRVLLGSWNGEKFDLNELHYFLNGGVLAPGGLYWDVLRIWSEIKVGFSKYSSQNKQPLIGASVDAWGVDFGLLDHSGSLLGNPHHYRDSRTDEAVEQVLQKVSLEELFVRTGVQTMQINTLFQLQSMVSSQSRQLELAGSLLMMPSLLHYFLCGEKSNEYTEASTTQIFNMQERSWVADILSRLSIPTNIFTSVSEPGTILAPLRPSIVEETGLTAQCLVIDGASHDTASAITAIPGLDKNSAFLCSGTWSIVGVEVEKPIISDQSFQWGFTNEGGTNGDILLLKNLPGLWLLQECQRYWNRNNRVYTWEELIKLAEQSPPFAFFLDSEARCFLNPPNMPEAIRTYCRETQQPVPENDAIIARGCLENITFKYRSALDRIERLTSRKLTALRVVGSGSQSNLLCQFTANATNRIVIAGPTEASALGNVMMQAIATGHLSDIETGRSCIASTEHYSVYVPEETVYWADQYHRFFTFLSAESRGLAVEGKLKGEK